MGRDQFVNSLIGLTDRLLVALWPAPTATSGVKAVTLSAYIELILRRSSTSYTTLLAALYYLALLRSVCLKQVSIVDQPEDVEGINPLKCQRRMFLAALMLSSKYTRDRSYSSGSWATISGLCTKEINANEALFLSMIDWHLYIPPMIFERWVAEVPSGPWMPRR
ncbi:cyclin-domain-containing protein [Diaporthe sp. PMI_573]|nr:cyclin-domain-containing protein [Diaporthaceae sp. PMI_573]